MEIKFRAWDKRNKTMTYNVSVYCDAHEGTWWSADVLSDDNPHNAKYSFEEGELMQYTGLKDKNGKEIYEGDKVKDKYGKVGIVKYYLPFGGFISEYETKDRTMHIQLDQARNEFEVIGNKWE